MTKSLLNDLNDVVRHIGLAKMDAQRWSRQPGGERLAALRERDATTLARWAREAVAGS